MTTLQDRPTRLVRPPLTLDPPFVETFRARAGRRRLAIDALVVLATLVVVVPLEIWLANGGGAALTASVAGFVTGLGIIAGLVGTSLVVLMLWLAARVPLLDRTIGYDRALALHADLGQVTFGALVLHAVFLICGYALADRTSWLGELAVLWADNDVVLAVLALGGLTAVSVSSIVAARKRLPREVWHAIHLLTHVAVLAALPHQFSLGGLFDDGIGFWFWALLWGVTFFVALTFRVFLPLFASAEHRLVVTRIAWETHDTVSIEMTGRRLDRLGVQPGQFLHWRFLAAGLWWHQHPFSISAEPHDDRVRITVRELGVGTRRIARQLRAGTRVLIAGPYGNFTDATRTSRDLVLVGIGIGVAPVRALLEAATFEPGHATVILRARTLDDIALLSETQAWCAARGVRLHVLTGRRGPGSGWLPASHTGVRLVDLAPELLTADLYLCGPEGATELLRADAAACGVPDEHIHHERFTW